MQIKVTEEWWKDLDPLTHSLVTTLDILQHSVQFPKAREDLKGFGTLMAYTKKSSQWFYQWDSLGRRAYILEPMAGFIPPRKSLLYQLAMCSPNELTRMMLREVVA